MKTKESRGGAIESMRMCVCVLGEDWRLITEVICDC